MFANGLTFSYSSYQCTERTCLVCVNMLLCKSDPAFADKIRHVRDPKARMQVVWNFCKSKMTCEPDEPKDENDGVDNEDSKRGHGGCGAAQPQIRKEGLKLFVQYKRSKDEDEVCISENSICVLQL